jgi:hypothetical protein
VGDEVPLLDGGGQRHHRHHPVAERLVGHPHDEAVVDGFVCLDDLLDLLGEHLLAAGVHDLRAAAEEGDRPVRLDRGPVAGEAVAGPLHLPEGGGGLVRVLVVAERDAPGHRHTPDGARARLDLPVVLVEHLGLRPDREPARRRRGATVVDRLAHRPLAGGHQVGDDHGRDALAQRVLHLGREHGAGRGDEGEAREVGGGPLRLECLEGPQHRPGEDVADRR